jgi:hypothetical protein
VERRENRSQRGGILALLRTDPADPQPIDQTLPISCGSLALWVPDAGRLPTH